MKKKIGRIVKKNKEQDKKKGKQKERKNISWEKRKWQERVA
jgi:hypothetical protein